jgi:serine-type D-Ala-D-Ala carboxypeptidase/endopeptidase (penicillin-binding protein 4)
LTITAAVVRPEALLGPLSPACAHNYRRVGAAREGRHGSGFNGAHMLALLFAAALSSGTAGPTAADIAGLAHVVSAIDAARPMRSATLGISVVDAETGKTVFAQDADKEFAPASNFKLVDAAAALAYIGPGYRYRTDLLERGTVVGGVLDGDLILRGGGDPVLMLADLQQAAKAVVASGITRVTGTVLPDDRVFDRQRYGGGWAWDDFPYYYQPPIQALSVDEGLANVTVVPGVKAGDPVAASIEPNGGAMTVRSIAVTTPSGGLNDVDCFRSPGSTRIVVVGHFPARSAPFTFGCAVDDASVYAAGMLWQLLADAGVDIGRTAAGPPVERGELDLEDPAFVAPLALPVVWSHESAPLHDLIARMMPPSDNFIAEHLFKMLPVAALHQRGTFDGGAEVERKFVASLGLDPATIDNGDGSGLSQGDRVTPHDLTTILDWEAHSSTGHWFVDALARAGINGTVRHHLLGSDAVGRVRAKDGYIWHVSTFSGYAWTKRHGLVVFSVMFNDADGKLKPFQDAQDKIVETIVDWP